MEIEFRIEAVEFGCGAFPALVVDLELAVASEASCSALKISPVRFSYNVVTFFNLSLDVCWKVPREITSGRTLFSDIWSILLADLSLGSSFRQNVCTCYTFF